MTQYRGHEHSQQCTCAYDLVHARGSELAVWLALDFVKRAMKQHSMTQHGSTALDNVVNVLSPQAD